MENWPGQVSVPENEINFHQFQTNIQSSKNDSSVLHRSNRAALDHQSTSTKTYIYFLRRMLTIPWTATKTNKEVFNEAEEATKLLITTRRCQAKFFGHVMRRKQQGSSMGKHVEVDKGRKYETFWQLGWDTKSQES